MNKRIAKIVVGLPVDGPFDYSVSVPLREKINVGDRINVQFNRQNRVGYVVGFTAKSHFKKLNPVLAVLDDIPVLNEAALQLTRALSDHYGCSWGEAIETYLPPFLRKNKNYIIPQTVPPASGKEKNYQSVFVHDLDREKTWGLLLEEIEKTLAAGEAVIVLVPESNQISAVVQRLKKLAATLAVIGGSLHPKEQETAWYAVKRSERRIIVGTRSAIFAPSVATGLIIIFDEDNHAYKQDQSPNYNANEIARLRLEIEGGKLLFVSAAPSAELVHEAGRKNFAKIIFQSGTNNKLQLIDMNNYNPRRSSIISFPLQNDINRVLQQRGRVLLFLNRKGFASLTRCNQCGHTMKCERCNLNLTYSYATKKLACRQCTFTMELPKVCPGCRGSYLRSSGAGVEKIESEVARLYPQARVAHYDNESTGDPNKADIVIATQAILSLPEQLPFDLVALLNFDSELNHFDYHGAQKAFALLVQLRLLAKEKIVVQTRLMDHYCVRAAHKWDFKKFYREELKLRKECGLPPYVQIVALNVRGAKEEAAMNCIRELHARLVPLSAGKFEVLDPQPDFVAKLRGNYRYSLLIKGNSVKNIHGLIKRGLKDFRKKGRVIITVTVDP